MQRYFISANLGILCGEGLFLESGVHKHSFALNLVQKTSEWQSKLRDGMPHGRPDAVATIPLGGVTLQCIACLLIDN
jgi:hypothetical protein